METEGDGRCLFSNFAQRIRILLISGAIEKQLPSMLRHLCVAKPGLDNTQDTELSFHGSGKSLCIVTLGELAILACLDQRRNELVIRNIVKPCRIPIRDPDGTRGGDPRLNRGNEPRKLNISFPPLGNEFCEIERKLASGVKEASNFVVPMVEQSHLRNLLPSVKGSLIRAVGKPPL
jgi:hypothetical protein